MASRRSFSGSVTPPKAPSFGGGNALMSMMMAQNMLPEKIATQNEGELAKASAQTEMAGKGIDSLQSQMQNPKVGTDITYGPTGSTVRVPLNEPVTLDAARALGQGESIADSIGWMLHEMKRDPNNFRKIAKVATARFGTKDSGNLAPFGLASTTGPNAPNLAGIASIFDPELGSGMREQSPLAGIMKDKLLNMQQRETRIQSGAQVNMQEFAMIRNTMPTYEDFTNPNDPTFMRARMKLANYVKEIRSLHERILNGRAKDVNGGIAKYNPNDWEGVLEGLEGLEQMALPEVYGNVASQAPSAVSATAPTAPQMPTQTPVQQPQVNNDPAGLFT